MSLATSSSEQRFGRRYPALCADTTRRRDGASLPSRTSKRTAFESKAAPTAPRVASGTGGGAAPSEYGRCENQPGEALRIARETVDCQNGQATRRTCCPVSAGTRDPRPISPRGSAPSSPWLASSPSPGRSGANPRPSPDIRRHCSICSTLSTGGRPTHFRLARSRPSRIRSQAESTW